MNQADRVAEACRAFVDYYDQAGIGDCEEGKDDDDCGDEFDGDERFNVRQARSALASFDAARGQEGPTTQELLDVIEDAQRFVFAAVRENVRIKGFDPRTHVTWQHLQSVKEKLQSAAVERADRLQQLEQELARLKRIEEAATKLLALVRERDWSQSYTMMHASVALDAALRAPTVPDEPAALPRHDPAESER